MPGEDLESRPGFRRRFVVTPSPGRVTAAVEDDYHCMAVTLGHDGMRITAVEPVMQRTPWTTCPGAREVLQATFNGASLAQAAALGFKQANCTHLYDLAVLAAGHADDRGPSRWDILVSDPVDGQSAGEIRRDGLPLLRLEHRAMSLVAPAEIAGTSLFKLRGWIESLDAGLAEAARLLQWGMILANGRAIPIAAQSDATQMPPNCFTFQPDNKVRAQRVGEIIDFSRAPEEPLAGFDGHGFTPPIAA